MTIGKSDIRKIHSRVVDHNVHTKYLMIPLSIQANILANELGFSVVNPDVFSFDRSKSRFVSRYEKVEKEEELLSALKCQKSHLPVMLQDDILSQYYGWKVGDIIHAIDCRLYRVVV